MRRLSLLLLATLLFAAVPAGAVPVEIFEIDAVATPEPGTGMIPIVPCQWIDLVAHVDKGEPGRQWHIDEVSMRFCAPGAASVEHHVPPGADFVEVPLGDILLHWQFDAGVMPCENITECEWVPWGSIHVSEGQYCQTFTVQADIWLTGQAEKMWSNILTFHVVPEPGTMLMMGVGLLGLAGLARRR